MTERQRKRFTPMFGFIGGGNMGGALMRGVLAAGLVGSNNLTFYDPEAVRRQELTALGVVAAVNNSEVMQSQVVILAVKPQVMGQVLTEIQALAQPRHLIISLAADRKSVV